ncbi:sporulation protein Cse60 [Bacillus toyonensis]|uniref:sporulation protein Cse60 n=1 Tax=Bacillus toyonensis TaxID=155322 RepID=UPI0011452A6D|nr:sporulation protein Cse60 [Bacillus toyonensis]
MVKVKIVTASIASLLESRMNESLSELSDEKIIDIKIVTSGVSSSENYLAVIMYDDGMK